ncbi:MAG: signal recognition particle-docking protein FtsY [Eubacteriales bacterium]|nr:signal recognition particle-docking protein FtsY [Eubacteriales bacterium]
MGIFESFKSGLSKTREFFADNFNKIAANLGYFDEEQLEELEMLLIRSDVSAPVAEKLMEDIVNEIKSSGKNDTESIIQTLRQSMLEILGPKQSLRLRPEEFNILLLIGVNGTGKTTSAGKIAHRYKKEGLKVMLAAADTFRAAAIEQLQTWGERADVPVIASEAGHDPAALVYDAIQSAKARGCNLLIIDTAGRLHNKQNLMDELAKIHRVISREAPNARVESLLTVDATTGQNALVQAAEFSKVTLLSALIMTKLDGNSKGGIALALAWDSQLPIIMAGLGEGVDDLQDFDPELFVDSLLPEVESLAKQDE